MPQNLLHGLPVGERQIFVNLLDLRAHGPKQRFGVARGAHNERGKGRVLLPHGDVCDGLRLFPDLTDDRGSHNADNLEQLWLRHNGKALSQRFLARPHHLGHGLVDDHHGGCVFAVKVREVAAAQQRNAHGFEVAGGHVVKIDERAAIVGVGLFAFAKDGARNAASEHAVGGHRSTDDAGYRFSALDHVAEKLLAMIGVITKSAKVEQ